MSEHRTLRRAPPGHRLLSLYPADWRRRYGEEMDVLLETRPIDLTGRFDLVRGALDAHLHPARRSRLPAWMSLSGGALWTSAALIVMGQRVPPDWPGYAAEMVPHAIVGTTFLLAAIVGAWLRLGDQTGVGARVALTVAVAGHIAWIAALAAALAAVDYGAATAAAATVAAVGTFLVSAVLGDAGDWPVAGVLALACVGLVIPWPPAWLLFGIGWSIVGFAQLREIAADQPGTRTRT